jgi:hypothetical protein
MKYLKHALITISLIITSSANAAFVDFNYYASPSDNDLVNNFNTSGYASNPFTQVQTGGITGGALVAPVSGDSNDSINYNQPLYNSVGATHEASVSFYYDDALVNPFRYNTAVELRFAPSQNWNNYGVATIDGNNGTLGLRFHGLLWGTGYTSLDLVTGHWYQLDASINNIGGTFAQIEATASIFDLGSDGLSTYDLIGFASTVFGDGVLSSSETISVEMFAEQWGGVAALDNYSVSAVPIPAALWLFGSGLIGLIGFARHNKA